MSAVARKRPEGAQPRHHIALRVLPGELADIDRRARALGLTRTDYMVRSALRKPIGDNAIDERVSKLEQRMQRVEQYSDLTN